MQGIIILRWINKRVHGQPEAFWGDNIRAQIPKMHTIMHTKSSSPSVGREYKNPNYQNAYEGDTDVDHSHDPVRRRLNWWLRWPGA